MKKRLRKKKHLGEFKFWGASILVRLGQESGFDEFLDSFIEQAIEANGCFCGGGGRWDHLDFFIELGRSDQDPEGRLQQVTRWLDSRSEVKDYQTGALTDAWYGPFEE